MYEHHSQPLIPRRQFLRRMFNHSLGALVVILAALGIGVLGYRHFEGLSWIDALLNASMILGGMGPVDALRTDTGKIFASFYALYSGIILLASVGVLGAPLFHRVLHRFHLEMAGE